MGSSIKADVGDSAMISRLTMQIGMHDAAESGFGPIEIPPWYHRDVMIASAIFLCLFGLLCSMLRRKAWLSVILFFISLILTVLLFIHHATDSLELNL